MAEIGLAGKSFIPITFELACSPNKSASIVALIQLTKVTFTTLLRYGTDIKNMSKDKNKIGDQLWSLQKVLEDVQVLAVDEESRGSSRLSALKEQLNAPNGLPRCRAELERLDSILKAKDGRIDHAVQALKWPLKQGEMKKTVDYLKSSSSCWVRPYKWITRALHLLNFRPMLMVLTDARCWKYTPVGVIFPW